MLRICRREGKNVVGMCCLDVNFDSILAIISKLGWRGAARTLGADVVFRLILDRRPERRFRALGRSAG